MIRSGPICWSNKNQASLTLSSAKTEYQGAVNASIQESWLHGILTEFKIHTSPTVDLCYDNQSTINISSDPVQKQRTKHIEVHMHYIREMVHDRTITLHYCLTKDQIADIFTKSFTENRFSFLRSLLGIKAWFSVPIFEGGFPKRFSSLICIMSLRLYIGWPMVYLPGPTIVQVRIHEGC